MVGDMDKLQGYQVVAQAVRVEYDEHNDNVYLVFEVTDEQFKKEIKEDWMKDVDLQLVNKQLLKEDK